MRGGRDSRNMIIVSELSEIVSVKIYYEFLRLPSRTCREMLNYVPQ
jgi:hypothetical protein